MKKLLTTLFVIIFLTGCLNLAVKPDLTEQIATSIAAKTLGLKTQGHMTWDEQADKFVAMIENDGITVDSGQILLNYVLPKIPQLYATEASILIESLGFEFTGLNLTSVAHVEKDRLLLAIHAFKEGLLYKK